MNIVLIPLFLARWCSHKRLIHLITETSTTYVFCNPVTLHEGHKIDQKVWITDFWLGRCRKACSYCLWHSMAYPCCLVWRNIKVMNGVTLSNIPTLSVCPKKQRVLLFDSPTQYYIFNFPLQHTMCWDVPMDSTDCWDGNVEHHMSTEIGVFVIHQWSELILMNNVIYYNELSEFNWKFS